MDKQFIYEYEKYITDSNNVLDTLNKYGVAIIPDILNQPECDTIKQGMWDYLENITAKLPVPIKKDKTSTWTSYKQLYPQHSMLLKHWSIGHAQFIWNLRTNNKIIEPFEKIWNVSKEDLLVSFDGVSFHMPPEITGFGWAEKQDKAWLHTDQSYLRNNRECVQGWVNAYDTNEGDATLIILEGSHKYHGDFAKEFDEKSPDDWVLLNQAQIKWYTDSKKCVKKMIKCPAGSLVLWDSRTIHCAKKPEPKRHQPNYRCVVYVCYTPRSFASTGMLNAKINAWKNLRTTSHWPHNPHPCELYPNTFGNPIPQIVQITKPEINELALRLIGYEIE